MAELHSEYKKNRAAEFKAQKEKEAADKKKEEDENNGRAWWRFW